MYRFENFELLLIRYKMETFVKNYLQSKDK